MTTTRDADARMGMTWWNRLTERERLHWLLRAGSDAPADAWEAFKAGLPQRHPFSQSPHAADSPAAAAHHNEP